MINTFFCPYEIVQRNPIGGDRSVLVGHSVLPRSGKRDALELVQEVNSIRFHSDLQDLVEIVRGQDVRAAKFDECFIYHLYIPGNRIHPYVDILGVPGFGMVDESQAADNEIPCPVFVEQGQHVFEVLNRFHG